MKKLLATVALSSLALIPATSAWAGGDTGPSTKDAPSAERVWAWGCQDHHPFVVFGDPISGIYGHYFSLTWCGDQSMHYVG